MSKTSENYIPESNIHIENNTIESVKSWQKWSRCNWIEEPDIIRTVTDIPYPIFNTVLWANLSPDNLSQKINHVISDAKSKKIPISWWLGPTTQPAGLEIFLRAKDFEFINSTYGMAAMLSSVHYEKFKPAHFTIKPVTTIKMLKTYCTILGSVFHFPQFVTEALLDLYSYLLLHVKERWNPYLATMYGKPVATAATFFSNNVCGLYNVATTVKSRGLGIGSAIVAFALNEAQQKGYSNAILCSTKEAAELYHKLGFKTSCKIDIYNWKEKG